MWTQSQYNDYIASTLLLIALFIWQIVLLNPFNNQSPYSTPIEILYPDSGFSSALPNDIDTPNTQSSIINQPEEFIKIGLAGDIMQHRIMANDNFMASYSKIAPLVNNYDLAIANLEFPLHPKREIGPPPNSVRFNGSPSHLKALASIGFDILVTANNHAHDQGLEGMQHTIESIEALGMIACGTGKTPISNTEAASSGPAFIDIKTAKIAIFGYTYGVNAYPNKEGEIGWPPRDVPIAILNFADWSNEYRKHGINTFKTDITKAKTQGATLNIAVVHWGEEWKLFPDEDLRLAAHDMIESGFDAVIGSHPHVLRETEIYQGKLIAYSLGNLLSAFRPFETRVSAILELTIKNHAGTSDIINFAFRPIIVDKNTRQITLVSQDSNNENLKAWTFAKSVLGEAVIDDYMAINPLGLDK